MVTLLMQNAVQAGHTYEEIGAGMMLLSIIYYLTRHFLGKRGYEKKLRNLETKMERDAGPEVTLSGGTKNPGRSTVDLVEVVYDEVKEINKTLPRHEGELGKIKGKLGIR